MSAPPTSERSNVVYAHPMGWTAAFLGGIGYGTVVGGVVYGIWSAVTQAPVGKVGTVISAGLWLMCFSIVLLIEWDEYDKIRKGEATDMREALRRY